MEDCERLVHDVDLDYQVADALGMDVSRLKSLQKLQGAYEGYYTGVRAIMRMQEIEPNRFEGICGVAKVL